MSSLADIAFKAADIIAEHGHCKHMLFGSNGECCLVGAAAAAAFPSSIIHTQYSDYWGSIAYGRASSNKARREVLEGAMQVLLERGWEEGPISFNNDPGTTAEDVILLLKETGKKLQGEP